MGNGRGGQGQEEELRGPCGEQELFRGITEDRHGDLPEVPGQGGGAPAVGRGRALEPPVRHPGAGRLGGGDPERRRLPGVVVPDRQVLQIQQIDDNKPAVSPVQVIPLPGGWMNMQLPVMSCPPGCAEKQAPNYYGCISSVSVELSFSFQFLCCFSTVVSLPEAFISGANIPMFFLYASNNNVGQASFLFLPKLAQIPFVEHTKCLKTRKQHQLLSYNIKSLQWL